MKKLSISLLSLENKDKQCEFINNIKDKAVQIHVDVTDEKFVSPKGVDIQITKEAKKCGFYSDVHLMVKKPVEDGYIDDAVIFGADSITIHYEIDNFEEELSYLISEKMYLKSKGKTLNIGIAIKLETDIHLLDNYINQIDKVLIMSVNVGYGGQPYDARANEKILYLSERYPNLFIEVDGGINQDIINSGVLNNVNEIVIGSAITNYENYNERIDYFLNQI